MGAMLRLQFFTVKLLKSYLSQWDLNRPTMIKIAALLYKCDCSETCENKATDSIWNQI